MADAAKRARKSVVKFTADVTKHKAPPANHIGRRCLLRVPGSDEWRGGTLSASRSGEMASVDVQMDDEPAGKPQRFHLATQPIHVADNVVWGGAHVDSVELAELSFVDGLVPVLIFAPFGPAEADAYGRRLAQSIVDHAPFWLSPDATRPLELHMWRRRTPPALRKALKDATEQASERPPRPDFRCPPHVKLTHSLHIPAHRTKTTRPRGAGRSPARLQDERKGAHAAARRATLCLLAARRGLLLWPCARVRC
jgi:hypothetical protein